MTGKKNGISLRRQLADISAECLAASSQLESVIALRVTGWSGGFSGKVSHSQPPWNSAVAFSIMSLHQLARDLESRFRFLAGFSVRERGGSNGNTSAALNAVVNLAETADDGAVSSTMAELDRWLRKAKVILGELEFPQRLPRLPGQKEPVCPFCHHSTLRMFPLRGFIACIAPVSVCHDDQGRKPKARMEYSSFTDSWELVWQDNVVGVPVEAA